ncbi:MAG: hypothetical protein WD267_12785 [Balneolales bacterium]
MRLIFFLLFLYLMVRIVRMMLVKNSSNRGTFRRTYTFNGSNPFEKVRRPNGHDRKRPNIENLEDAEFEEIEDDDEPNK